MSEKKTSTAIQDLMQEVEIYKQAIRDAEDALESAELELDETLDAEFNNSEAQG